MSIRHQRLLIVIISGLLFIPPALGSSLKLSTQTSTDSSSSVLSWYYNPEDIVVDLSLATNNSRGSTSSQSTEFDSDVSYEFKNKITLGGGLNYSYSSTDTVSGTEPHISMGYNYEFGDSEEFKPSADLILELGSNTLKLVGARLPALRDLSLNQKASGLTLILAPWKWFSVKMSSTKYSYDKDVQAFITSLGRPQLALTKAGLFSSATQSLEDYQHQLIVSFYLGSWTLKLSGSSAQQASNGDKNQDGNLQVGYDLFKNWNVTLGGGQSYSPSTIDNYLILNVSYNY